MEPTAFGRYSQLSLRTVQRIENAGSASPESTKAIAAAFGLEPCNLMQQIENKGAAFVSSVPRFIAAISLVTLCSILYLTYSIVPLSCWDITG